MDLFSSLPAASSNIFQFSFSATTFVHRGAERDLTVVVVADKKQSKLVVHDHFEFK